MFSKTADPTSAPRPATGGNASRSILGSDLKITGEITSSGTVEVMGEIDGNLSADTLTIGQEGRISGSVNAKTVEVKGKLDGKVSSDSFTMRASSQVTADITYMSLVIESGATIEGRFARPKA
jgi:cytoskeletal protein CcmA (bactofilin family)